MLLFQRSIRVLCSISLCMAKQHDEYTKKVLTLLGNRFRTLRIAKGYTNLERFAYESEIGRAQYGRYENGEDLRFSSLLRVLKGLDISLTEFFGEGFEEVEQE